MAHKKVFLLSFLLAISVLFAGLWLIKYRQSSYRLLSPKRSAIKEVIYGIGTVQARQKFSFKVGLPKTVEVVFVKEGDFIKKGQPLIRLSDSPTILSPIEGTVVSVPFHQGENVFSDQPVIEVQNLKDRYLTASLEQLGALRVKAGMPTTLSFESLRQEVFRGKIQSLYPKGNQFLAHIEVTDLPAQIIPGMTADVGIEVAEKDNALLVPARSVNSGMITVIRSGKRKKVSIKTGIMDQEWVEVTEGDLSENDQIVVPKN